MTKKNKKKRFTPPAEVKVVPLVFPAVPPKKFIFPCVLIVDDREENHVLLRRLLGCWGVSCGSTFSGEEAVRVLREREGEWDLVLMDLRMRGMDGVEAVKKIREFSEVPVVMMVGLEGSEREECLAAGADECLREPFYLEELKEILTRSGQRG